MPGHDVCEIRNQEDYNEFQMGCVNIVHSKFIDNNNNTVWLELKSGYMPHLDEPVEFPIGSHDNYYFVPAPHYEPPYPLFVDKETCDTIHDFMLCCGARPFWSIEETIPPEGKCVMIDDTHLENFGRCCVESLYGTYTNPLNGTVTTSTEDDPATQFPGVPATTYETTWSSSDYYPAKSTHTVTVTKCLV
ncbi:hypothetical protein H4R22_003999 [Coemansia sp. RSA 1290]|nr:hypothetical protein H4R22_003999 [Coemansia sp. RSA 1290]